jgi:hypothetical protein
MSASLRIKPCSRALLGCAELGRNRQPARSPILSTAATLHGEA